MITHEQYKLLFEKVGQTGQLTPEEEKEFHEYECWMTDQKYGREHTEGEIGKHTQPQQQNV